MENILCSNCGASLKESTEFCDSCGEWQGVSPVKENSQEELTNDRKRVTTLTSDQLNAPIHTFKSSPMPTRKEVPGIRAVFFILVIFPVIAGAAFWYNNRNVPPETSMEEPVVASTSSPTTTTVEVPIPTSNLNKYIVNCSSSSEYGVGYSCSNLYDGQVNSWQDSSQSCKEGYVTFIFEEPMEISFFIVQNLQDTKQFKRNWKIRELRYSTTDENYFYTYELQNTNESQWVEMEDTITTELTIDFLSAYPGEEYGGSPAFSECAIQEIEIFGKRTGGES
ncbi:MAG: zinc ribbon domain-containing protein [Actinomycetota bacterium]|nr:zinc ribbon domain-containing protein [Actinomycetota bacterium]